MNPTAAPYRFHAFEVSYFSAKVRPALRYKQLWYEELRADYQEIHRRTDLYFVPILVTPDDETWQDSTEIYDRLEERHPDPPLFPATPVQRMAAHLVELYVDEFGTIPAMHYRWGNPVSAAATRARFGAMIGSRELGNASADRMAAARLAVGASVEAGPAIEAHTRELLDGLSAHFEENPYLLGGRMCFGDCALMGPLFGHFFNDLGSRQLLLDSAVPVVGWIERCNIPNTDGQGEWLADDALAPTLREVLRSMGRDAAPVILDSVKSYETWADDRPAELDGPPRSIGPTESEIRGTKISKATQPYTLWIVQRTLDRYRALDPVERKQVDEAVAGSGWEAVLAYEPRHRLAKRDFGLVFESGPEGGAR